MFDLITIGNISVDIYFKGKALTFHDGRFQLAVGGKYFVDSVIETIGGGGANVAIGGAKNNLRTAVMGKVGNNPFKRLIMEKLETAHVETSLCQFEDNYLNISSLLLNEKGERTVIHYSSLHQQIIKNREEYSQLRKTKAVYFGNLENVSLTERLEILRFLRKNNILSVVNLGVKDCRRPKGQLDLFLKHTDILIINGYEFSELVKAPYNDIHYKEHVIKWYIPELKNKIVVITEGDKGSFAYFGDEIFHQPAIKPEKIVDTTGAGDGYSAGFMAGYLKTRKLKTAMEKGAYYAAKIITKMGAN